MGYGNLEAISTRYRIAKNKFFERNSSFKKFANITDERKDEIRNNANSWLEIHQSPERLKFLLSLYTNLNDLKKNKKIISIQNSLLDFENSDEELLFFMFAVDPELKLLTINYEENKMDDIKKRYREEFGITFDKRLLLIELAYNNKFKEVTDEFEESFKLSKSI